MGLWHLKGGCGLEIFNHSGCRPSSPLRTKSSTVFTKTEYSYNRVYL